MFVRHIVVLGTVSLIGAVACASRTIESTAPEPRPLARGIPSFQAPDLLEQGAPITGAESMEPADTLTLRDALALALMNNPDLAAHSWEVRAREAEVLQAGAWPNPAAAVEVENFGGSGDLDGFGGAETTLGVFQFFELGGKRAGRQRAALHARNLAEWDYETRRVDVLTDVTKHFVSLLVAQEQAALAAEQATVAERMLESVTRRVEAGGISPVEQGRARVELQTTRIDLQRARLEVEIARQRLSAMWGVAAPRFAGARGSIEGTESIPPLEDVETRIAENPDVARWAAVIAQRESIVSLERLRRVPDLELGVGFRHFGTTNDHAFVAEAALPLPIFNRNREATRAAERRVAMASEEHRAASIRVSMHLGNLHQQLMQSENEVTQLRDDVLPEATSTFESARAAYEGGRMRLTDVLDTQRTLFSLRSRYYDALGTYHRSRADMERLIGGPLAPEEGR